MTKYISLKKGEGKEQRRYVFEYEPGKEDEFLDSLAARVNDPNSGFTSLDFSVLAYEMGRGSEFEIEFLERED